MIVGGAALGAARWGAIPGLLRAFLRTNEIITSLMLNYVAALVLNYLIFDSLSYWRDTSATGLVFPQGEVLADAATWPVTTIGPVAIPFGFLVAVCVAVVIWVLYTRTRFGFEAQVIGDSPRAARYAGDADAPQDRGRSCALSGAIAGNWWRKPDGQLPSTCSTRVGLQQSNYGYTGIVVAALARYNPFAVVFAALPARWPPERGVHAPECRVPVRSRRRDAGVILFAMLGGELLVQVSNLRCATGAPRFVHRVGATSVKYEHRRRRARTRPSPTGRRSSTPRSASFWPSARAC